MPTAKRKSVLDRLPNDLAFLKPCVRAMLKLRVGFRPSVDPEEHPEEARDQELDRFLKRDTDILGRHLREAVPAEDADEFVGIVRGLQFALLRWLKPHNKRYDDPEVAMLQVIVGYLGYPFPHYRKAARKKPRRATPARKTLSRRKTPRRSGR